MEREIRKCGLESCPYFSLFFDDGRGKCTVREDLDYNQQPRVHVGDKCRLKLPLYQSHLEVLSELPNCT